MPSMGDHPRCSGNTRYCLTTSYILLGRFVSSWRFLFPKNDNMKQRERLLVCRACQVTKRLKEEEVMFRIISPLKRNRVCGAWHVLWGIYLRCNVKDVTSAEEKVQVGGVESCVSFVFMAGETGKRRFRGWVAEEKLPSWRFVVRG